jgi:hypothetical protein
LGFYENFGLKASSKPVCIGMWEKLAAARSPRVILPPGVVIGNYCPPGHKPSKPGEALEFERRSESFQKHRDKVERHGIPVHEVGAAPEGHGLPLLGAGVVSA